MPNFIDDRHWGLLAYIGNKARAGKLKDANITVADVDLIIAAIQDRDRVIRGLNAKLDNRLSRFV
jgi:3-oxoacyl-[acyl-carrier-protein] synthase III